MEIRREYMRAHGKLKPSLNKRVHGYEKGVHEGYMRDQTPVSRRGT